MTANSFSNLSPVFILGIARSGTTLLQSLLDGHPQLLVDIYDSRFVYWYRQVYRWPERLRYGALSAARRVAIAEKIMLCHAFNEASPYYRKFLSNVSISEIKNYFHVFLNRSQGQPKDYLESYMHALGLASGYLISNTHYWVDKTLSYEYLFYRYIEWWPDSHFIHMIRDPRDVYASYKVRDIKNKRPVISVDSFALTWSDSVRTLLDSQRLVAENRRFVLRYEDLISDVDGTMKQVADFLGIEFGPGLLLPTKGFGRVPWGGNAVSGIKRNVVFRDAADKWSRILSSSEVTCLEGLLHREMVAVGYELSQPVCEDRLLSARLMARRAFFRTINWGL